MKKPTQAELDALANINNDTPVNDNSDEDNSSDDMVIRADKSNNDGEIPLIRWSNRRKMAWKAFYAFLIYTAMYWFFLPLWFQYFNLQTSWLNIISDSFFWFAVTMSAIILGYMGFTTLPFLGKGKRPRVNDEDY